jgi:hypothetical protein
VKADTVMIERSGLYVDTFQQSFFITQGIMGGIMIAGKQTLFRIYIDPDIVSLVDNVGIRVRGPIGRAGERDRHFFVSKNYLVSEPTFPHGHSVGVILLGDSFPFSGEYELSFWVHESGGNRFFFNLNTGRIRFYPTKDLRLLVVYLDLSYLNPLKAPRPGWYYDIFRAMNRLGSLYPVRDGVQSSLNGDRVGIRYQYGTPYVASANADMYNDIYGQTRQINSSPGDHVDVTVEYRRGFFVPEYLPAQADPRPGEMPEGRQIKDSEIYGEQML